MMVALSRVRVSISGSKLTLPLTPLKLEMLLRFSEVISVPVICIPYSIII